MDAVDGCVVAIGKYQNKLVTGVTCTEVWWDDDGVEHMTKITESLVADEMAILVIDLFELI